MKKSRSLLAPSRSLLRPAPVPRSKSSLPFGLSSDPGSPGIDEAALAEFSDTIACVQVLEQSFPRSLLAAAAVSIPKGVSIKQNPSDATVAPAPFPVVLVSQLYSMVKDRTVVDREVQTWIQRRTFRKFQSPLVPTEFALCRSHHHDAYIAEIMRSDEANTPVYQSFASYLHTSPPAAVTHCVGLIDHLKIGSAPSTAGSASRKRPRERAVAVPFPPVDECIRILSKAGMILRDTNAAPDAESPYILSIPKSHNLFRWLLDARGEVKALLRKRRTDMPLDEFMKLNIRCSPLPSLFHLRDILGADIVEELDSSAHVSGTPVTPGGDDSIRIDVITRTRPDGGSEKVTRRVKLVTLQTYDSPAMVARRNIPKFGLAAKEAETGASCKAIAPDEIHLTPVKAATTTTIAPLPVAPQQEIGRVCRKCKGPHFTHTCSLDVPELPSGPAAAAGGQTGAGSMLEDNSYLRTVKIANLSVEANRDDVRELFGRFGWIENVRVISEKAEEGDTSMAPRKGIGLAFVTFRSVEEAHRAVAAMDRYRYEHQLLNVSISTKRAPRPGGAVGGPTGSSGTSFRSGYGKPLAQTVRS